MKYVLFGALAAIGLNLSISSVQANGVAKAQSLENTTPIHLDVFKDPQCGCCKAWIDHVELNNFTVTTHHPADLSAVKAKQGIGMQYRSCHTGVSSEGYVFEGHIPSKLVEQFLANPPKGAIGLSVPGMPVGSPGMEYQNKFQSYPVLLLNDDGSVEEYARITHPKEQY